MNYKKKTMQDWNKLTEEQQTEVIMHIGNKLTKQEIWYWEGLVYSYRTLQDRISKAITYIKENAWYDYRDNEEVITIPKEKLLDILQGSDKE